MAASRRGPWSQTTKDRAFYVLLVGVGLLVLRLLLPYAAVLMFATVVVTVTWPVYARIRAGTGRPAVAAVFTTLLLATVVGVPLALLGWAFAKQAMELGNQGLAFVQQGGIQHAMMAVQGFWARHVPAALSGILPDATELTGIGIDGVQTGAMSGLQAATTRIPTVLSSAAGFGIDAAIFVGAVGTFYAKGPEMLAILRDLLPIEDRYVDSLYDVFRDLANHVVTGTLATAAIQGLVATLGYAIAGVDGLAFFGSLTALCALVPIVGGALIYLPLVVLTGINHGIGWALFLLVWQVLLTSQVDTFVRPFFLRGQTHIHPLLIFLSVVGGLGWLGFPGALAGPVIVTAFAALYLIYRRDFLGKDGRPLITDASHDHPETDVAK
jgi:predicted PurR-regulated permease PerM